jgi:acetylornithine deacetylase/succinyl-diaminopimelate desuccinylase-like protein
VKLLQSAVARRVLERVDEHRVMETAVRLCGAPSPTGSAGLAAEALDNILREDGFAVERLVADWPPSPAVAVRFSHGSPARTIQFNGHLDTVHLPYVPPRVQDGILVGSGAADMKGGVAAAVEALRALREGGAHVRVLLTAHDYHEAPWGDGRQLRALIREGYVGDGVLLPEYLSDRLAIAGRGLSVFRIRVWREGKPVHEVLRPAGQPDLIGAGCEVVRRLKLLNAELARRTHPVAGAGSIFVGKFQAGEIFNQSPTECWIEGTRRWLPGESGEAAREQFRVVLAEVAQDTQTHVECEFSTPGDAFELDPEAPLARAFQTAHLAAVGRELPVGLKPFLDDGNNFARLAGIPAVTHGPDATGAHTVEERVPIPELVRVANVYALTAIVFCAG